MSTETARYVRELLVPSDGSPPAPDIAALPRSARHLLEVVSNMAGPAHDCWPSVETIARRMGITAANVRRARSQLVRAGVIAVDQSPGGDPRSTESTNRYRFPLAARLSTPRAPAREVDGLTRAVARGTPRGGARHPARWRATKYP